MELMKFEDRAFENTASAKEAFSAISVRVKGADIFPALHTAPVAKLAAAQ